MAQKLGRGSPELGEQDIFAMDALTLAYIGDVSVSYTRLTLPTIA